MSSRTFSIDKKGLSFTARLVCGLVTLVGCGYAYMFVQENVSAFRGGDVAREEGGITQDALIDEETRELTIERLLRSAEDLEDGEVRVTRVFHYVPEQGRFASVDLVAQEVTLYEDGARIAVYPIIHAPSAADPHALKEDNYIVQTRNVVEVSQLTLTRLPQYVDFGGGAFHGVPTDEQGGALEGVYPGGSIQLANDAAVALFDFMATGTPLHVRVQPTTPPYAPFSSLVVEDGATPATSASSFVIVDMARGQVVLEKNAHKKRPIASITKLFTMVVAREALAEGERVQAPSGEYYTLGDLFYPLLLRSDNAVADAIAAHVGTRTFIAQMNNYARTVGLPSTSFADASGLSPYNLSSAADLAVFARHLYLDRRFVLEVSKESEMTLTSETGATWHVENQNKLASDPHFVGGKLGFTDEAGQTALSIFNVPIDGEMRTIAVAVLGSADWKQDTRTLLRWLLENVEVQN